MASRKTRIKADYHIHSCYSADAPKEATLDSLFRQAVRRGFSEIAITDHIDFREDGSPWPPVINYTEYAGVFNRTKEKYSGLLNAAMGIEMSLAPHVIDKYIEIADKNPFDFIIGSSHSLEKIDIYVFRDTVFNNRTKREAYELYFTEMLSLIKNCPFISVYGHLDFIIRYGPYKDKKIVYEEYSPFINEVLKKLIETGKGIELNTSGYNYGLKQPHPSMEILKAYKRFGGEIITVGSDAHGPAYIGAYFDRAEKLLREAGFKAYTIFRERKPVWIDL